jgi:hypothetical protein
VALFCIYFNPVSTKGEEAMLIRIGRFEVEFGFCREFFVRIPYIGQMHYSPYLGLYVDGWKTWMALEGKYPTKGFFCLII